MTIEVTPIRRITVGEQEYDIAAQSDEVQQMAALYNDWREREVAANSELRMIQTALSTLGTELARRVVADNAPKADESTGDAEAAETPAAAE